ncbi:hypothetical protein HDG34_000981 [Paraburkholderia sp. HC6.4b]|uniref:hypothetical protein n=1 Tax=unclassified Paraburkholderia TaxID=2615204 RepID=UPI00161A1026|nr:MULTISPECIES: hypothetical protein [unclassified Paraburkholderia]MBB5407058.1 hypothetical protein [Paraburkholderia sp. HC6.4b]MBB5449455.1 hypothetical protein [Paraburkholderia sp. Kb1A]
MADTVFKAAAGALYRRTSVVGRTRPTAICSVRRQVFARSFRQIRTPGSIFGGIRTGKIPQTRSSKAIAGIFSFRPCHQTIFPIPNRPEDIASRISHQKPFSHTGIIHPGW